MVKGMAAEECAPHRSRLRKKKIPNTMPGMNRAVMSTLLFQRRPPITAYIHTYRDTGVAHSTYRIRTPDLQNRFLAYVILMSLLEGLKRQAKNGYP